MKEAGTSTVLPAEKVTGLALAVCTKANTNVVLSAMPRLSTRSATRHTFPGMSTPSNFVSLHPYFRIHSGKLEAVKAGFPRFVEKTATEKKNLFYGFTINGDEIFCREGYTDAEGVLAHLDNVGALLAEMLTMADLTRVEVHGPAAELEKLRKPLAHLNPAWFAIECSVKKT